LKIIKTYRRKLKLNKGQEKRLLQWIGTCRFVYNLALEQRILFWSQWKKGIHKYEQSSQLSELRKEYEWINDVPFECLQLSFYRLDKSYQNFFRGGGFPKFAKRDKYNSIMFKQNIGKNDNKFRISKIGWLNTFKDREVKGKIKQIIIKKEIDSFYINIVTEFEQEPINISSENQVGIDMGLVHFATLSTGEKIKNPGYFVDYQGKLRMENRSLARKKKGSNNRRKQKIRVQKVYRKIKRCRKDFLHKESIKLINQFGLIVVEDLNVSGILKINHLSKLIQDASWSKFFNMLEYKSNWYGNKFIKVDPKYTSQTCNVCGYSDKENRTSQSEFECKECDNVDNADFNASKNILERGLGKTIIRKRKTLV